MRLESSVNLLVATLDLKLVRLLRDAMGGDGKGLGPGDVGSIVPAPTVEPRRRFHPTPVIEPRRRIEPEPRIDSRPVLAIAPLDCPEVIEVSAADKPLSVSPIQPPWKVLPWQDPPAEIPRPVHRVKVVVGPPDTYRTGNVIDLFI